MGWLTSEELIWDERGRVLSNSPANYKIPTAYDLPTVFNTNLFERPNLEDSVYSSKAVGEPPLILGIAVWCALRDACSSIARYKMSPKLAVPATPEQVYWAVKEATRFTTEAAKYATETASEIKTAVRDIKITASNAKTANV